MIQNQKELLRELKQLKSKYTFCFYERSGYKPIMKATVGKKKFTIKKKKINLSLKAFDVEHGLIKATGYIIMNKIAYISDCNGIPKKNIHYLYNMDFLILDCLKNSKHPSHFNFEEALELIKKVKPKKAILTNLHTDLDYFKLKKILPKNILPAFDGMSFNF